MQVRELSRQEILPALHLIWAVFIKDVAPSYTSEGIEEFRKTIKYETILSMHMSGEITMFGAFEGTELIGTISVKNIGHIFLFYVKSSCQGKGAGRQLFQAVYHHCRHRLGVGRITVNAAPGAVPKYIRMGMHPVMPEQHVKGMCYTPMEMVITDMPSSSPGMRTALLIAAAIIGGLILLLILTGSFTYVIMRGSGARFGVPERRYEDGYYDDDYYGDDDYDDYYDDYYGDDYYNDYYDDYYNDGGYDDYTADDTGKPVGLDSVKEEIADDLSYKLGEDSYSVLDIEKQNTGIEFSVQFPVVDGLEKGVEEKVNGILKDCAMESVKELYLEPSDELKEKVIMAEYPMLTSYVRYKVCFASDELLSVAFEDASFRGSYDDYAENLRTVNIDLKSGTVYQVKDIVELNDAFIRLWLDKMREDDAEVFSELSRKEIKESLAGNSMDGVYVVNFFLDRDGINIGYDLNYKDDSPDNAGYEWLVASFERREIEKYATDSEFWREWR